MGVGVGEQIARLRHLQATTQEELAERAGVSVDIVRCLEQGTRRTARLATLNAIARGLDAELSLMITPRTSFAPVEPSMLEIRRAMTAVDLAGLGDLGDLAGTDVPDLVELRAAVDEAWRVWHGGDYSVLGGLLPALIVEAREAIRAMAGDDQMAAHGVLTQVYEIGAGVAIMLGHEDLASLAADRALRSAERCGDLVGQASAMHWVAWILRRQGRYDECIQVANRAAERYEPRMLAATPEHLSVWGGLLVNAAGAAARCERGDQADELLSLAKSAAARLPRDRWDRWSVFGPRICAQAAVIGASEIGDHERATRAVEDVDRVGGRVPQTWESRYLLAVAYAWAESGNDYNALVALMRARQLTPEWVRYHRHARDVTLGLLDRARTRRSDDLVKLARHLQLAS